MVTARRSPGPRKPSPAPTFITKNDGGPWFFTDRPRWGRILSHDGEVGGYPAMLWRARQVETAVIVPAHAGGDTAKRLNREIRTVVVGPVP
jgi:hypothetical protein